MKILFVGASFPPLGRGGTEVHMLQLGRALLVRGHEVSVFCRRGGTPDPEYSVAVDQVEGLSVYRVQHDFKDTRGLPDLFENRSLEAAFSDVVETVAPDLVHVHHVTGLSTTILDVCRSRGIPTVTTLHDFWTVCLRGQRITETLEVCSTLDRGRCAPCLHGIWPHFGITKELLEDLHGRLLRRLSECDALITPSLFHRDRMVGAGLPSERVHAIPHGLDHSLIPERQRLVPESPRKIGFIGGLIPTKGVHLLVEAFNRIGRADLELHLYGEAMNFHGDTGYADRLRALARPDLDIQLHGAYEQADLPAILRSLDVIVVPSLWWETFCLTIREALLAGVPVLASDLGAMHEALAPLNEDLLFRPGDPQDLVHKLHALLHDPERYARLTRLRHHVRTLEDMASDTEALYRRVAGHPERKRAHAAHLSRVKCKGTKRPYATVFFPTYNGGPLFERILDRVLSQKTDFEFEVLCIDSGSRDQTVEVIKARPRVRLVEIPNSEFNHGLTRNRGVALAKGEIVALLTQDAEPYDDHWLQSLVDNFDDPDVAGAYCHQLPRENCNPFQRDRLKGWTSGEGKPIRKRLNDPKDWETMAPYERYLLIAFDDVASCVRKEVMEAVPFEKRQFGEDVTWGKRAILTGHTLVMDPRSVVIHSHNNPIFYEFKRVYLDHQNLHDLVGLHTVPRRWLVARFSVRLTARLLLQVARDDRGLLYRLSWMLRTPLYGFSQNLAQYLGARSVIDGKSGKRGALDRWLSKGV